MGRSNQTYAGITEEIHMKILKTHDLKHCSICQKPLRHFNKSGLCLKHNALEMQRKKMADPGYRAFHNLQRQINYTRKKLEELEYEKANWGKNK